MVNAMEVAAMVSYGGARGLPHAGACSGAAVVVEWEGGDAWLCWLCEGEACEEW